MAPQPFTPDEFAKQLKDALRGKGPKAGVLAPKLLEVIKLGETITSIQHRKRRKQAASRLAVEAAERFTHVAARSSAKLLTLLGKHNDAVATALADGNLPATRPSSLQLPSDHWESIVRAILALQDVQHDAGRWLATTPAFEKPGAHRPKRFPEREMVARWVAIYLRAGGVALRRSSAGTFARVLELVYYQAGIEVKNTFNDVVGALDSQSFRQLTANTAFMAARRREVLQN